MTHEIETPAEPQLGFKFFLQKLQYFCQNLPKLILQNAAAQFNNIQFW